jgi:hypothetical protein
MFHENLTVGGTSDIITAAMVAELAFAQSRVAWNFSKR